MNGNWMGSLSAIDPKSGYWIMGVKYDVLLLMGTPTPRDTEYTLDAGANLISYPFRYATVLAGAIPIDAKTSISGIIGEGVAANNMNDNWMISLNGLEGSYGYWLLVKEDMEITFKGCNEQACVSLSRQQSQKIITNPKGYEFAQSTQ